MEPHGRNNAPANEWTFDGGLNDDNENDGINNNQQENKNVAAISPSQKLDGEIPMGNRYRGETRNTLAVVPGLDETRSPGIYSGFKTALEKIREKIMDPASVDRELGWQKTSFEDNPEQQREFRDQVVQVQHFRAFALMRVDSPYITICHSIGKIFDPIGDASKGWQGKYVGFVGDRREGRVPFAIVLPEEAWTWTVPVIESNDALIADFYKNEANYGRLYLASKPSAAMS